MSLPLNVRISLCIPTFRQRGGTSQMRRRTCRCPSRRRADQQRTRLSSASTWTLRCVRHCPVIGEPLSTGATLGFVSLSANYTHGTAVRRTLVLRKDIGFVVHVFPLTLWMNKCILNLPFPERPEIISCFSCFQTAGCYSTNWFLRFVANKRTHKHCFLYSNTCKCVPQHI